MAFASGDILVYDGAKWVDQPSLSGPIALDSPTFYVDSTNHRVGIGTTSLHSRLHVTPPFYGNVAQYGGGPDLTDDETHYILIVAGGDVVLPSAVGITGRRYVIEVVPPNNSGVTIQPQDGEEIDGEENIFFDTGNVWNVVGLISNGTDWDRIA